MQRNQSSGVSPYVMAMLCVFTAGCGTLAGGVDAETGEPRRYKVLEKLLPAAFFRRSAPDEELPEGFEEKRAKLIEEADQGYPSLADMPSNAPDAMSAATVEQGLAEFEAVRLRAEQAIENLTDDAGDRRQGVNQDDGQEKQADPNDPPESD